MRCGELPISARAALSAADNETSVIGDRRSALPGLPQNGDTQRLQIAPSSNGGDGAFLEMPVTFFGLPG
jgi:hypothetical protein